MEAGLRPREADGVTGGGRGLGHVKPEAVLVMTRHQMEALTLLNRSLGSEMILISNGRQYIDNCKLANALEI